MSDVETVALWAGLVSGIVSVVLSIVAIVFAVWVNQRASEVSDKTIQALQKIESTVERLSGDTSGLIKAAWDKMLVGVGANQVSASLGEVNSLPMEELAAGLAAELRSNLGDDQTTIGREEVSRIESTVKGLEESLTAQLRMLQRPQRVNEALEQISDQLRRLTPNAREIVRIMSKGGHLTRGQYVSARQNPELRPVMAELREYGLLVPLRPTSGSGPVYWLPSDISDLIRVGLLLFPEDADESDRALSQLASINYGPN